MNSDGGNKMIQVCMNLFEPELDNMPLRDGVMYLIIKDSDLAPNCTIKVDKESDLYQFCLYSIPCINRNTNMIKGYKKFDSLKKYIEYVDDI